MSEKMYALLLRLYPCHFRKEYGAEALELFRDRLRDEQGFLSTLRLWFDVLTDVLLSLPGEYRRKQPAFTAAPIQIPAGIPCFQILESETPSPGMLMSGTIISLVILIALGVMYTQSFKNGYLHVATATAPSRTNAPSALSPNSKTQDSANLEEGASSGQSKNSPRQETSRSNADLQSLHPLEVDATVRQHVINGIIHNLQEHYPDQGAASKMADMLLMREKSGAYNVITSGMVFASLLTTQMRSVSPDIHLKVIYSKVIIPTRDSSVGTFHPLDQHFAIDIPKSR